MSIARLEGWGLALAALGVVGAAMWVKKKGVSTVVAGAVGAVADAAAGVVVGAGQVLGIPATDPDKCASAMASGSWWDASKYCPATTFVSNVASAAGDTLKHLYSAEGADGRHQMTPEGTLDSASGGVTGDFSFPL